MGLTLLYSLLDAVKLKNSGLKTWFGIWNLGLESEIFQLMKNVGISYGGREGSPAPAFKSAKCKSRAANAKNCAAASILYMLYPTITWGWNLVLYSIESACQSGV